MKRKKFDEEGNVKIRMGSKDLPSTEGGKFANSIKMWIDPKVWDLIPQEIAKQIDERDTQIAEFKTRIKQFLSALDYDQFSGYQHQLVAVVEKLI